MKVQIKKISSVLWDGKCSIEETSQVLNSEDLEKYELYECDLMEMSINGLKSTIYLALNQYHAQESLDNNECNATIIQIVSIII